MTWPDGRHRADEEPPTVVIPPVRDEPPGIPGLHYMPGSPTLLPGPDAAEPGYGGPGDDPDHRGPGDGPRRPWPWLAGLAAVAVLAALGVAWTFGRATDPPPRTAPPAPTASVTEAPTAAPTTEPEITEEPTPTTTSPPPSLSVTVPPVRTVAPAPPTTPRPGLVRVPGVVGERRTGAQLELRRAGFEVTVREVPVDSRRQERRVVLQLPPAGTPVPAGSTVVLLVGERD